MTTLLASSGFEKIKELGENFKEKFRSFFNPQDPRKKKDALPPKAHFSIWYFLIVFLIFSLMQQYFLSRKVETSAFGRPAYSEEKAGQIDGEVSRVIEEAHQRVLKILSERRKVLDDLAHLLSKEEIVQGEDLRKMLAASAKERAIT